MSRTLYIDSAPFIGGAQLSLLDDISRNPDDKVILAGWEYSGSVPFVKLSTRHWPASLTGTMQLLCDALMARRTILQALAEFAPDCVYLNTVRSALLLAVCGIQPKCEVILRDRDVIMPKPVLWLVAHRLRFRVSAVSKIVAEHWHDRAVEVVPNEVCVDTTVPAAILPFPENALKLIQVADFVQWKRHDLFIKAVALALKSNPNIRAIIKGRIHDEKGREIYQQCLKLVDELQLHDKIIINTENVSALPYIKACDILVSCSENEPFGRVIQEARALGKRVVEVRSEK